jgi:DNA anti-recombination protein RmuC
MSASLDEVRRRLELRLDGADKVLKGFKKEIADDIRPEVRAFMNEVSQRFDQQLSASTRKLDEHLKTATAEAVAQLIKKSVDERKKLEKEVKSRLTLLIVLSGAALLLSLISLLLLALSRA